MVGASWDFSELHVDDLLPWGRLTGPDTMQHASFNHAGTNAAQTNPQAHIHQYTTACTTTQTLTRTDKTCCSSWVCAFTVYQSLNENNVRLPGAQDCTTTALKWPFRLGKQDIRITCCFEFFDPIRFFWSHLLTRFTKGSSSSCLTPKSQVHRMSIGFSNLINWKFPI